MERNQTYFVHLKCDWCGDVKKLLYTGKMCNFQLPSCHTCSTYLTVKFVSFLLLFKKKKSSQFHHSGISVFRKKLEVEASRMDIIF